LNINLPASVHVSLDLVDSVLDRACASSNFAYSRVLVILWIDHKTKSADLSSEDFTQCMEDILLQKLIFQYRGKVQIHSSERSNKSKLPGHIRFFVVALTVQSKGSVLAPYTILHIPYPYSMEQSPC
jgi:hypothetical protein